MVSEKYYFQNIRIMTYTLAKFMSTSDVKLIIYWINHKIHPRLIVNVLICLTTACYGEVFSKKKYIIWLHCTLYYTDIYFFFSFGRFAIFYWSSKRKRLCINNLIFWIQFCTDQINNKITEIIDISIIFICTITTLHWVLSSSCQYLFPKYWI